MSLSFNTSFWFFWLDQPQRKKYFEMLLHYCSISYKKYHMWEEHLRRCDSHTLHKYIHMYEKGTWGKKVKFEKCESISSQQANTQRAHFTVLLLPIIMLSKSWIEKHFYHWSTVFPLIYLYSILPSCFTHNFQTCHGEFLFSNSIDLENNVRCPHLQPPLHDLLFSQERLNNKCPFLFF